MPRTLEVSCADPDCPLDMVELHYSYDMPSDVAVSDFTCPYCGSGERLEELAP